MRNILILLLLLSFLACSKENVEDSTGARNKYEVQLSTDISFKFLNSGGASKSSSLLRTSSQKVDFYSSNVNLKLNKISIFNRENNGSFRELSVASLNSPFKISTNNSASVYSLQLPVLTVPLELGAYSMFAIGDMTFDYVYNFSSNGNERDQMLKANLLCFGQFFKSNWTSNNVSNTVDIAERDFNIVVSKDVHDLKLANELKIVNGPLILRFEEFCNHPLSSSPSNPYWSETRNKALEYIVNVDYYKRDLNDLSVDKFATNVYKTEEFKVILFFHSVFVYKKTGDEFLLVDSSKNGDDSSTSGGLDNGGYCDLQIATIDKAKVRVAAQRYHLTDYPDLYKPDGSLDKYYYRNSLTFTSCYYMEGGVEITANNQTAVLDKNGNVYNSKYQDSWRMYMGTRTSAPVYPAGTKITTMRDVENFVGRVSDGIPRNLSAKWNYSIIGDFSKHRSLELVSDGVIQTEIGKIKKYLIHLTTFDGRLKPSSPRFNNSSSYNKGDLIIECNEEQTIILN